MTSLLALISQFCTKLCSSSLSWTCPNCAELNDFQFTKLVCEIANLVARIFFLLNVFIWMKTEENESSVGLKLFILKQENKDLNVLVQHRITMSHHLNTALKKVNVLPGCIRWGISSRRDREILILLDKAAVQNTHLDYCVQFWSLTFKKNEFACEQKFARIIQATESPSYKRRLKELGLFNLAKRWLKGREYFFVSSSRRPDYFQAESSGIALPEVQLRQELRYSCGKNQDKSVQDFWAGYVWYKPTSLSGFLFVT